MNANILTEQSDIQALVQATHTIAVIGMRDERDPDKPAFEIPAALHARGFELFPVNPNIRESLGRKAAGTLAELARRVDLVQVFRRSDAIGAIADEVLALPPAERPIAVWLQTGIRNDAAAEKLAAAGIKVVQDRCLAVESSLIRR